MTRQDAKRELELIKSAIEWDYPLDGQIALDIAIEALEEEPKHGKWLDYLKEGLKWKCSECGSKYTTPWHYCPNCGARMESDKQ